MLVGVRTWANVLVTQLACLAWAERGQMDLFGSHARFGDEVLRGDLRT